jgi:hypothetical protein
MAVLWGLGTIEDLSDEIDDGIAACAETPDDLEFVCGLLVIRGERWGDTMYGLSLEIAALFDKVAGKKDVVKVGRKSRDGSVGKISGNGEWNEGMTWRYTGR